MRRKWLFINRTSDLYVGKSTLLKVFLAAGVLAISALFIWHTFDVVDRLQIDTRDQVEKYVRLWQLAANAPASSGQGTELQFIFDEIIVKANFPIVVLDSDRQPVSWRNIPGIPSDDTTQASRQKLTTVATGMFNENGEYPLYFGGDHVNYLRYGDSDIINQLKVTPFVAVGVVLAFMVVAIIGFQNIRRSEERYIWVGMAKETAHQLGTPLSSLLGWLEMISPDSRKDMSPEKQEELFRDTAANMEVDVERLQRVANRFGMIGSIPELNEYDLNELVNEAVVYYRRRLPFEGHGIQIIFEPGDLPPVRVNAELFTWALENLIKNSLQAVDSRAGRISVRTRCVAEKNQVVVEVMDNGKGITVAAARKIFRPGFTTKKRGWGMGLTLVRRIAEEYHTGRVSLVKSRPGETLFALTLPVSEKKRKS